MDEIAPHKIALITVTCLMMMMIIDPCSAAGNCRIVMNVECAPKQYIAVTEANYYPNTIKSDMRTCVLSKCGVKSIAAQVFRGYTKVMSIDLSHNYLTTIEKDTFADCSRMHTLSLSDNLLVALYPEIFQPLTGLARLFLKNNFLFIAEAPKLFLYGSEKLRDIYLEGNADSSDHQMSPHHDEKLYKLTYKSIQKPPTRTDVTKKLEMLMSLSTNVQNFNLSHNAIPAMPARFLHERPKLSSVDLSHNALTRINVEDFDGLFTLTKIYLNDNAIRGAVPENAFFRTNFLLILELHNNRIESLPPLTFSKQALLQRLTLQNNLLKTIPEELFRHCLRLKYLDVSGNAIVTLAQDQFLLNTALTHLDFSHNRLQDFPFDFINHLTSLTVLKVDDNELEYLAPATGALYNLTTLSLACNHFVYMPQFFLTVNVGKERNVTLHGNPWRCACLIHALPKLGSVVKYDRKHFTDGASPTCITGENSLVCDNYPLTPEDNNAWTDIHWRNPNICGMKYAMRSRT